MINGYSYNIFTNAEMKHILDLITLNEHTGEYYGNQEAFEKRNERIKKKIEKEVK